MTKPKKWFLDSHTTTDGECQTILKNADGIAIKKPNASSCLGSVLTAEVPEKHQCGKYSPSECVLFTCENGRIVLCLKYHEWNKSAVSSMFRQVASSSDFVERWGSELTSTSSGEQSSRKRAVSSSPGLSTTFEDCGPPATKKRCSYAGEGIDERIEKCRKGLMQLPLKQLLQPPRESRLIREPDPTFVKNLKQKMIADPSAPGATPMAVLCKGVDDFNTKYKDVYKYEVLGGLHTMLAKAQLAQEFPENPFFSTATAEVYVGLSDEEALRLAQRHNLNSHFVHKLTHRDLIEACRARLYAMESRTLSDETPKITAAWKESCKRAIIPDSISNTHRDSIFYQASLPKRVWERALQVVNLYEEGKLKGQKLNLSSLLSKPEFKQQYLAPIRALEEKDQCLLLDRVSKNEISLAELKEECSKLKQLHGLRLAFVRLTNSDSWEDAQEKLPQFATDEQLLKFINIDIKKAIPKSFSDFCLRAKNSSATSQAESVSSAYTTDFNTVSARVVQAKFTEITGTKIKGEDPSFTGANLVLTTFEEGCTQEDVESILYTIKEINSVAGCCVYTAACMCSVNELPLVREIAEKVFINTEVLFWCDNTITGQSSSTTTLRLLHCVKCIVLCFFSTDDTIRSDHFKYDAADARVNFILGDSKELYTYIVQHFSQPKSMVLDLTTSYSEGMATLCALKCDRHSICIADNDAHTSRVLEVLSTLHSEE